MFLIFQKQSWIDLTEDRTINSLSSPYHSHRSSYQKLYEEFVLERTDKFSSWKPFEHAKALAHRLNDYNVMQDFRRWCNEHMDFLEPKMNIQGVILTCHTATNVIIGSLKRYYPRETVSRVIFETLKLAATRFCFKKLDVIKLFVVCGLLILDERTKYKQCPSPM